MERNIGKAKELTMEGFVEEFAEISKSRQSRKFCFVLGAGASIESGIMSGAKMARIWDEQLAKRFPEEHAAWRTKNGVIPENIGSFYSELYDRRYAEVPEDGKRFLENAMDKAAPSFGYVMLSKIMTETSNKVVITTNFDHLVEDSIRDFCQEMPLVIGHEALAHHIPKRIDRPTVVKIHRDLLLSPKSSTQSVSALDKNWVAPLTNVFREYHPVFIGYAGNDPSVMKFLEENAEKFQEDSDDGWRIPYWLLYPEGNARTVPDRIKKFLERSGGFYVWHEGFDKTLFQIAEKMEYKLPDEKEFLDKSQKRYRKLNEAFTRFTAEQSQQKRPGPADAGEEAEQTADAAAGSEQALAQFIQAVRQMAGDDDARKRFSEALELWGKGKQEEACTALRSLIKDYPDNAQYHSRLGAWLYLRGDHEGSLVENRKLIELEPDNALHHGNCGVILRRMGKYDEAKAEQQKAIELEPDNPKWKKPLSEW